MDERNRFRANVQQRDMDPRNPDFKVGQARRSFSERLSRELSLYEYSQAQAIAPNCHDHLEIACVYDSDAPDSLIRQVLAENQSVDSTKQAYPARQAQAADNGLRMSCRLTEGSISIPSNALPAGLNVVGLSGAISRTVSFVVVR